MGKIFLFSMLFISINVSGQVISEKEIVKPSGEKSGIYGRLGLNSAVKGAGNGPLSNAMVAAAEVTKLKDNGFVIRTDYSFSKYDDNGVKQWTTEIKRQVGLQNQPQDVTIGDQSGFYFVELKQMNGTDFFITHFDNKGEIVQTRYMPTEKTNENVAFFMSDKGLNVVHAEKDKKTDTHTYKLITFSSKDLSFTEKVLALESDAFEMDDNNNLVLYPRMMLWNELKVLKDKVILYKSYKKEEKGQEGLYIVKTIELSLSGEVSNLRKYAVESPTKYLTPSLEISMDGKELYVFGYTTSKDEKFTDGLFIHKIDYVANNYLFRKEYPFSNLAPGVVLDDINFTYHTVYPVRNLIKGVYEFDNNNGQLKFFLLKSQKSAMSNMFIASITIDAEGNVVSVYDNKYDINPLAFKRFISKPTNARIYDSYLNNGSFFMAPMTSEKLYAKDVNTAMSPLDFIETNPDEGGKSDLLWCVVPAKESNFVFQFNGNNSGIRLFKLKK